MKGHGILNITFNISDDTILCQQLVKSKKDFQNVNIWNLRAVDSH